MVEQFQRQGWLTHPVITAEEADYLAEIVRQEALALVFHQVWDKLHALAAQGINPTHLLTDNKLRQKYLPDPKMVWRNGNSRQPFISASCGMVNIYHQPQIRDRILFNPSVIETIRVLYSVLLSSPEKKEEKVKLRYALGPDRLGLKPYGAKDMKYHMDSNIFEPFISMDKSQVRVQAFVTLRMGDEKTKDLGGIEVLEGFHHYIELAAYFFQRRGVTPWSGDGPYDFETINTKHLPAFITWLEQVVYPPSMEGGGERKISLQLDPSLAKRLPQVYIPVRWVKPPTKAGELLCFDTRLPHRNTRNQSQVDRIVAYVSLYPDTSCERWVHRSQADKPNILAMFRGEPSQHGGSNRSQEDEARLFAQRWKERTNLVLPDEGADLIKEVLGVSE